MAGKMYKAVNPRPKSDGGTWWNRVGTAFTNEKGNITVILDAYPIPDSEGKVKIMLFDFDEQEQRPALRQASTRPIREELDDDIPF